MSERGALTQNAAMPKRSTTLAAILALCGAFSEGQVRAALGGDVASVEADAARLRCDIASTAFATYERRDLSLAAGGTVSEFLNPAGQVFAVSWRTPVAPDLQQLLGARYADYAAAVSALEHPGLHRSMRITLPGLIIDASGRPRAYDGRAYLPAAWPSGLAPEALR